MATKDVLDGIIKPPTNFHFRNVGLVSWRAEASTRRGIASTPYIPPELICCHRLDMPAS